VTLDPNLDTTLIAAELLLLATLYRSTKSAIRSTRSLQVQVGQLVDPPASPACYHKCVTEISDTLNPRGIPFGLVAPYYDILMDSIPYQFWLRYLQSIWDHYKHQPHQVLDVACGTGSLALLMAKQGLLVTGVDISGRMLDVARKKSSTEALYVEYIEQDASELELEIHDFDTVVSVFDSLNNITDPERLRACFSRTRSHMCAPGTFIFDLNTAYAFREKMFDQKSVPADGPLQYRWKSTYDEQSRLCTVVMNFIYHNDPETALRFQEVHVQRAYAKDEVIAMLLDAGFSNVDTYDAYSLTPPKRRSDRIFFVAQTS
jgi:ubiquinone/menaquinone biosynthesis C-methylase UbiE